MGSWITSRADSRELWLLKKLPWAWLLPFLGIAELRQYLIILNWFEGVCYLPSKKSWSKHIFWTTYKVSSTVPSTGARVRREACPVREKGRCTNNGKWQSKGRAHCQGSCPGARPQEFRDRKRPGGWGARKDLLEEVGSEWWLEVWARLGQVEKASILRKKGPETRVCIWQICGPQTSTDPQQTPLI